MTPWQIHYPTFLPFKYAVKNYTSNVKGLGLVYKDSVLLDNPEKTLFTKEEWIEFQSSNYDMQILRIKIKFNGFLLTENRNKIKVFDRSK